jgi:hypothetical protein
MSGVVEDMWYNGTNQARQLVALLLPGASWGSLSFNDAVEEEDGSYRVEVTYQVGVKDEHGQWVLTEAGVPVKQPMAATIRAERQEV